MKHKNDNWHRVKRSSGKFLSRFRLPENAKLDQIYGAMENGFLTVTIPKEDVKKPNIKTIEISGPCDGRPRIPLGCSSATAHTQLE
ncbi:hypothetical protein FEM48_Zijuj04G0067300 [Ziziphus jujuba var. spinosa]|uniref:SHSP domain-containing protein n=1 Tax=Ziziphus jujuba var. spinosa TaxID=714518 RepID=A0A978VIE0_ZIZJJ|nr:hypothetical protein FEM48_Zijuj04G0067300 [Ziziphus jujuba var. spinosa]